MTEAAPVPTDILIEAHSTLRHHVSFPAVAGVPSGRVTFETDGRMNSAEAVVHAMKLLQVLYRHGATNPEALSLLLSAFGHLPKPDAVRSPLEEVRIK
ncbi:hypothetical protein [Deinococcus sp. QL22]|uniref:hypothetical protein n=1 Tax=Deinococcus sp. QL22 TaxID=2939437 RepID=UPI002017E115|nr:hypothetical protein [Deinococcus sp. QL22]UQN10286.1 hypothetical protein M1R55_29485 [Deinococcus sp. QL22]UQN10420.1 hypothetical protein M1R55_28810 [Deinococcus sp. QL22]